MQSDERWAGSSIDRLGEARGEDEMLVNPIVVAELSRDYASIDALRGALAAFDLTIAPIDDATGSIAGRRFIGALRGRPAGTSKRPLSDFFISARAAMAGAALLTRDARLYRRYFPELTLITPETDHG